VSRRRPNRRAVTAETTAPRTVRRRDAAPRPATLALGVVTRVDARGVWVDHPGNRKGALLARLMMPVGALPARGTLVPGQPVILLVAGAGPSSVGHPVAVVLGLLQPLATEGSPVQSDQPIRIAGRRLELEAFDELVMRCGEASITLRRNGRAVVRGDYVETRARGVNRIKGGSVSVN